MPTLSIRTNPMAAFLLCPGRLGILRIATVVLVFTGRSVAGFSVCGFSKKVNVAYFVHGAPRKSGPLHSRTAVGEGTSEEMRDELLELIADTPRNAPTPKSKTEQILEQVRRLESVCPTADKDVLASLGGAWELVWTAQDRLSNEWSKGPLVTWINPLENQAYSNNPNSGDDTLGRFNPVLPRQAQDRLEELGVIEQGNDAVRSSQSVDLQKRRVRNVVAVNVPALRRRASLTVDVRFKPNDQDKRRVDVKFDSCRLTMQKSPLDLTFPLGFFGPTGWLRTGYIDDTIRITRGHKGSVFVLKRTSKKITYSR